MHLRKSRVLKKIREGGCAFSFKMNVVDPRIAEIAAMSGIDCIWIDMEHTYMSYKEVLCHLNAARSVGAASVVRLPQNDLTVTKKILEMGPEGIIFPMMRTPEEVREMIGATLYPPHGNRGFGPMNAIDYGLKKAFEFTKEKKNKEIVYYLRKENIVIKIKEFETTNKFTYEFEKYCKNRNCAFGTFICFGCVVLCFHAFGHGQEQS